MQTNSSKSKSTDDILEKMALEQKVFPGPGYTWNLVLMDNDDEESDELIWRTNLYHDDYILLGTELTRNEAIKAEMKHKLMSNMIEGEFSFKGN